MNDVATKSKGMGIAGMVCGILSLVIWFPFVQLILGILGCVFGGNGIRLVNLGQAGGKGMAIAGLVTGIIGTIFGFLVVLGISAL
jgi:hypothetical protein